MSHEDQPPEFPLDEVLNQIEQDPRGWSWLDLCKALDHCKFAEQRIGKAQGWEAIHRYHPQHRDLDVVLYQRDEVAPAVARRVVSIIRELQRRMGPL